MQTLVGEFSVITQKLPYEPYSSSSVMHLRQPNSQSIVGDSVGTGVGDSVGSSVGSGVGDSVGDAVTHT